MRFSLYILAIIALFACKKGSDKFPATQLVGHAGSGLHSTTSPFHDNTKESVEYALSFEQIEGVEVDIRVSKDGTAWMYHNTLLDDETNGTGCVATSSDDYLSSLHYRGLKNERLARLIDLPQDLKGRTLMIDFRNISGCDNSIQDSVLLVHALEQAKNHFAGNQVYILCNDASFLSVFQSWGWKLFLNSYNLSHFQNYPTPLPFDGVCWSNDDCTAADIQTIKSQGKQVILFSLRAPKSVRKALKKEANFILIDNLKEGIIEKFR